MGAAIQPVTAVKQQKTGVIRKPIGFKNLEKTRIPVFGANSRFSPPDRTGPFWYDQRQFVGQFLHRHGDATSLLYAITRAIKKGELGSSAHSAVARENAALAASNRALLEIDSRLIIHDLKLSWSDESVRGWCESKAAKCGILASDGESAEIRSLVARYGLEFPDHDVFGEKAALARCADAKWWRRQVRKLQSRTMDQIARDLRTVHRRAQPYCADEVVRRRRIQKRRNAQLLEVFEAENQYGEIYTLAEQADLSVSRPEIRRAELMVRMRGFEEVAQDCGHAGLFITVSTPSEYHPCRVIRSPAGHLVKVIPNPNYTSKTPREAQEFLSRVFARIRAKLKREGIGIFGFRVSEPHHDGTPHWHLMLFFLPEHGDRIKAIFTEYSLKYKGDEPGAKRHRVKFVDMDPSKGTATGYIAKYISKNIDGYAVGVDNNSDLFSSESAPRIEAWATCHGIRQFQQIGGPSVTVWRELRRLDGEVEEPLEAIRAAADSSDWRAFVHLMGGPFCGRNGQPVRPALWQPIDTENGVIDFHSRYGEESCGRLFGLRIVSTRHYVLTRVYTWTIRRAQRMAAALDSWADTGPFCFSATGPPVAALDLCQ